MKSNKKIGKYFFLYLFRLLFLLPLFFLFIQPLYDSFGVDIVNYYNNYINQYYTYDIGFELISYISYSLFHFSFNEYWYFLIVIEIILISKIYNRLLLLFFAYPSLISSSQFFFGTSVRYALASLLFCLIISKSKSKFIPFIAVIFHKGIIFSAIPIFIYKISIKYIDKILNLSWKTIIFIFLIYVLSTPITEIIIYLSSITSYSYYSYDTRYTQGKSLISTLYIFFYIFTLLYVKKISPSLTLSHTTELLLKKWINISLIILIMCVLFSGIMVLSGRILLIYTIIEPIIIYILCKIRKTFLLGLILYIASILKIFFYGIIQL